MKRPFSRCLHVLACVAVCVALAIGAAQISAAGEENRNGGRLTRSSSEESGSAEAPRKPPNPEPPAGSTRTDVAGAVSPPDLAPYVKTIEKLRGLTFKTPVASGVQSDAEFRAFLEQDLDVELPAARAACTSRALARLGLLPERFDLRKTYSDMMSEQVAAYYDPYRKTFYVLHPLPRELQGPMAIHELTHALQDQTFGLESRMKALHDAHNEDAENAFRFLVEGEATYVMVLASLRGQGTDPRTSEEKLDGMIDTMAGTGRAALGSQLGAMKDLLSVDTAAADSALSLPDFLFRVLYDPYFGGQRAVHKVRRAGGWAAVNDLWKNPPASTEMFLHPEKLARGKRDEPVKVTVPDLSAALGAGYTPACENTFGELETEILLETTLPKTQGEASPGGSKPSSTEDVVDATKTAEARVALARTAAAGWGGDRWRAFEKDGGGTIVVWKTVWDTEGDAIEFHAAMSQVVAVAAHKSLPVRVGKEVTFIVGANWSQTIAVLGLLYPSLGPDDEDAISIGPSKIETPAPAPAPLPSTSTP